MITERSLHSPATTPTPSLGPLHRIHGHSSLNWKVFGIGLGPALATKKKKRLLSFSLLPKKHPFGRNL